MAEQIAEGAKVFLADGAEAVGAVRELHPDRIVIYVENAGDFPIPRSAIRGVHSGKVMLRTEALSREFLTAVGHSHDREDPEVAG